MMPTVTYKFRKGYRYGFNGQEKDDEVKGQGNSYTTEFRQYDHRIGRWLSLDPLMTQFPSSSPFVAFADNPIYFIDPYGLEPGNGDDKKDNTSQNEEVEIGNDKKIEGNANENGLENEMTPKEDKELDLKKVEKANNVQKQISNIIDKLEKGTTITPTQVSDLLNLQNPEKKDRIENKFLSSLLENVESFTVVEKNNEGTTIKINLKNNMPFAKEKILDLFVSKIKISVTVKDGTLIKISKITEKEGFFTKTDVQKIKLTMTNGAELRIGKLRYVPTLIISENKLNIRNAGVLPSLVNPILTPFPILIPKKL